MVDKLIKDGKVAVLVSPGYGAGWSTWAPDDQREQMVFDPDIAQAVLDDNQAGVMSLVKVKYPDEYHGGVEDLVVRWVDQGDRFEIREYDGNESIRIFGPDDGYTA